MQNEKRLIDANELKRRIIAFATGCHSEVLTVDSIMMMLNQADTVDAVEVVRCRDCRFYNNHAVKDVVFDSDACHWNADEQPDPDDFCSAGERKEQNDER